MKFFALLAVTQAVQVNNPPSGPVQVRIEGTMTLMGNGTANATAPPANNGTFANGYWTNAGNNSRIALAKPYETGGRHGYIGRIELKHGGRWGTVCDDLFNDIAGRVACQSLGFGTGWKGPTAGSAKAGTGKILLDNVVCTGTEPDLFQCRHNAIGVNNCNHREDTIVKCVH